MIYTFIARRCEGLPVAARCRAMARPRRFTPGRPTPLSNRDWADARLTNAISDIHVMSRRSHGSPRVHDELFLGEGVRCSRKRVERLMRQAQIVGIHRRKSWRGCTRRDAIAAPTEDLVMRQFAVDAPDRLWVMDVTEHPSDGGKVYLAVVMDAWSRRCRLVDR